MAAEAAASLPGCGLGMKTAGYLPQLHLMKEQ